MGLIETKGLQLGPEPGEESAEVEILMGVLERRLLHMVEDIDSGVESGGVGGLVRLERFCWQTLMGSIRNSMSETVSLKVVFVSFACSLKYNMASL